MQSIHAALRLSRAIRRNAHQTPGTAVVFGFPYLDTLKMCGRKELSDGVDFLGFGDDRDINMFKFICEQRRANDVNGDCGIACVFTEFPSNPLLKTPDLRQLRALADEYGFLVVADDTIGNFGNVDLLKDGVADVICTSLTKLFSGTGNVMAGSCVISGEGGRAEELVSAMQVVHGSNFGDLYEEDAGVVVENSGDFAERNMRINDTTERLARWLDTREEVDTVYYPSLEKDNKKLYDEFLTPKGGYGSLLSVVLNPSVCEKAFYNHLQLSKGPSLGTNFTLACPYTMLAHYHELEFARAYGVSPGLIRVAVGLEDVEAIKGTFERSFRVAREAGNAGGAGAMGRVRRFSSLARRGGGRAGRVGMLVGAGLGGLLGW